MLVLRGRCPCGNVEISLRTALPPASLPLRACACSFCRGHGARTVTDPAGLACIAIADAGAARRHRFSLRTADYVLCRCGAYAGAVVAAAATGTPSAAVVAPARPVAPAPAVPAAVATLNASLFDPPLPQPATPVDYGGESAAHRLARRRAAWTPAHLVEIAGAHDPAHVPAVRALFEEYQAWIGLDLSFQGFDRELAALPGDYAPPAGRLLLARVGDADAACVALHPWEPGICEMKRLYVRAPFRGLGLGRLLARRLIADARALGHARMRLDTLPSMREALSLYTSLGFRDVPPYRHNPVPGTRYLELDLGAGGPYNESS